MNPVYTKVRPLYVKLSGTPGASGWVGAALVAQQMPNRIFRKIALSCTYALSHKGIDPVSARRIQRAVSAALSEAQRHCFDEGSIETFTSSEPLVVVGNETHIPVSADQILVRALNDAAWVKQRIGGKHSGEPDVLWCEYAALPSFDALRKWWAGDTTEQSNQVFEPENGPARQRSTLG